MSASHTGDIVERAKEVLKWNRTSATYRTLGKLVPELLAELSAARAMRAMNDQAP